jgi:hypothetical protein
MRRGLLIAIATAATFGGSLSAHLVGQLSSGEAGEARNSVPAVGPLPALLAVLVVVAALFALRRTRSRRALLMIACLAPLAGFTIQELLERMMSVESSPFGPGREPGMVGAIGAMLPWIAAAYMVVRALVAVARAAASSLAPAAAIVWPVATVQIVPPERLLPAGRYDPILDRPPRAPPRP